MTQTEDILRIVRKYGPISKQDIAEKMGKRSHQIQGNIGRLDAIGRMVQIAGSWVIRDE